MTGSFPAFAPFSVRSMTLAATLACAPFVGAAQVVTVNQGSDWTRQLQENFYVTDQGSRIMPLSWMRALDGPDGSFLGDSLARYGYLPMKNRPEVDVPVGFTIADMGGQDFIGMNCSACHTRQIEVNGTEYRIDGGPAIVDFQNFLLDLDNGVLAILADEAEFAAFAAKVLGASPSEGAAAQLRDDVQTFSTGYHTLVERSLPDPGWGPSRLDAVSMIFNRLTGLDIGEEAAGYIIADNILVADAPVRYPFLWNAARQDFTQWPGFAANGNDLLGLARNLGEVYGVFANFHPEKQTGLFSLNRNYLNQNSANFEGLKALEDMIWKIGAPQWPWEIDHALATTGEAIYERAKADGGCTDCHGIEKGAFRSITHSTWKTPILDDGTDTRECGLLTRSAATGIMEGAKIIGLNKGEPLGDTAPAFDLLTMTVGGAIIQHTLSLVSPSAEMVTGAGEGGGSASEPGLPPELQDLQLAFPDFDIQDDKMVMADIGTAPTCAYEARVLEGIWAAAPYLHNGSVPTLAALLETPDNRPASFKLGPAYDIENVGMAVEQTAFDFTLVTTDCNDLNSGNSRCGHTWGTDLSSEEKSALLEYLKSL